MQPETPLRALAPSLWVADRPLKLAVGDIGARMTVVRLRSGGLFLHSPILLDEPTRAALDALGPVTAVVAPNKVHHFFVSAYRTAYPHARVLGAPGLAAKRKQIQFDADLGDQADALWHGEIEQHVFRGAPYINEVVFFHPSSRTLVLTDLAFNVPAGKPSGARLFHRLVGATGRFGPHRILRLALRDRRDVRNSVERILQWDFDRIIVSHGEVLESGGKSRFAEAFAFV